MVSLTAKVPVVNRWIPIVLVLFLTGLLILDQIFRLLGMPIVGTYDIVQFCFCVLAAFAMSLTQKRGKHVVVSVLVDRYPLAVRNRLELANAIIAVIMICLVAYGLLRETVDAYQLGETTPSVAVATWPFYLLASAGMVLFALGFVGMLCKRSRRGVF